MQVNRELTFASAVSYEQDADAAAAELAQQLDEQLSRARPDVALLFPSHHYAPAAGTLLTAIRRKLEPKLIIGCTGEAVIGKDHEIEGQPAVTVVAARLEDVKAVAFKLRDADLRAMMADPGAIADAVDLPENTRLVVLLSDPFSTPMDAVLEAFNRCFAGVPVIGGMASGARSPGQSALMIGDRVYNRGAVAMALAGPIDVDVIVSQGCRPIGPVLSVTESSENVIFKLEDETPLAQIQELVGELSEEDRNLLRNGLFVGRAIDSEKDVLGRGDFLIRGVVGVDQNNGAIAVGDYIREGEAVQFHLRDAATAKEDLEMMLTPHSLFGSPSGALLFSCNGRGTRLYSHPDGDVSAIHGFFKDLHLAGFFCAGEIGPIGGRNFLHGHTASLALIRPRVEES